MARRRATTIGSATSRCGSTPATASRRCATSSRWCSSTSSSRPGATSDRAGGDAMTKALNLTLHVWRQPSRTAPGKLVTYQVKEVSEHASFLEMLDLLNEQLIARGEEPVAFDHDCREGICGMCSLMINGRPHGGHRATTTCQLHMRHFHDGQQIWIEPWRAHAFPVLKDLCVDRSAFDRVIAAGGYITANVGS